MNKVIQKKNLKYIKLFLISPVLEIITNLVFMVTFLILAAKLTSMGKNFTNYEIFEMTKNYFLSEKFEEIKNEDDFIKYFNEIRIKLFTYDSNKPLPLLIPSDPIRLTVFSNDPKDCSDNFNKYFNNVEKTNYKELMTMYKGLLSETKCGSQYKKNSKTARESTDPFSGLVSNFPGVYGSYNIFNGGESADFSDSNLTLEDYEKLIGKREDLKFVVMQINMKIPSNENYLSIVAGMEMVHNFAYVSPLVSITVYSNYNPNDSLFLSVFILFCISVSLTSIKLLYEANIKFILSVHVFSLFNEALNILLIIFISFFLSTSSDKEYDFDKKEFKSHLPLICIRKFIIILLGTIALCLPFRLISLLSWNKTISKPFVKYISIIFRMLPG